MPLYTLWLHRIECEVLETTVSVTQMAEMMVVVEVNVLRNT